MVQTGSATSRRCSKGAAGFVIYHFMLNPTSPDRYPSCTWYLDALGDLPMLSKLDTTFALVSRAPFAKLEAYRKPDQE